MDRKEAIERERAALKRIVALLFALADLAELASGRSPLVRAFVLWLLRHAERVARDLVAIEPTTSMPDGSAGNGAEDAMRLAISLRGLARQLNRPARLAIAAGRDGAGERSRMPSVRKGVDALCGLASSAFSVPRLGRAPDTS